MDPGESRKAKRKGMCAVTIEMLEPGNEKETVCTGVPCMQTEDIVKSRKIVNSAVGDMQGTLMKIADVKNDIVKIQSTLKCQTDAISEYNTEEAEIVEARIQLKLGMLREATGKSTCDFACLLQ